LKKGILSGIGAYLIWGFMPIWLKQIQSVPALQILAHRIVWSLVLLVLIILLRRQLSELLRAAQSTKILLIYTTAATLLAANWLTYIYAVNSNHIVESSLGYFINPLVNVLLGVVVFRERLRPWQWLPVGIATVGVTYLTIDYGRLPWIALVLAVTFALYAVVKKAAPLGPLRGLAIETAILVLPAMVYLAGVELNGSGHFTNYGLQQDALLAFAGVITSIPLLLFGTAARSIPLSMVGLLQYIAPTCQFLLGVLVYREPFTASRLIGFAIIWAALAIFWGEGFITSRRNSAAVKPAQ
jgi:chloramphenicol-sensitive protein RarD